MTTLIADGLHDEDGRDALQALRVARRKNRLEHLDWFDAFYKAYVTAVMSAVGIYAAAEALGDAPLTASQLASVRSHAAAWVGLVAAVMIGIGLRSGGRGGPLAFERADVRHVLLAPVDRRFSIRRPALRQLRYSLFVGVVIGGAAGLVVAQRMPEAAAAWVACGALLGGAFTLLASGAAMIASGLRLRTWMTDALASVFIAWSVVDVLADLTTSPLTMLGTISIWPLHFDALAFAGLVASVAVAASGALLANRCSIEAAERRSRLVGQLRFAATLQDVRTVMVLQRQLAQEQTRQRPWIRLPKPRKNGIKRGRVGRMVFIRRGLSGLLRWPALRLIRLLVLIAVAGFCVPGIWSGTSPLVVVAGLATWLAALDLSEALAQEVDHPDRLRSTGQDSGAVLLQHALLPLYLMLGMVALASVPFLIWGDSSLVFSQWPVAVFIAATAIGGATLTVNARPPGSAGLLETPEIASVKFVVRTLLPPGIAIAGFVPLVPARDSWIKHHDVALMLQASNPFMLLALAGATMSLAWLRYGDRVRESIASSAESAKPAVVGADSESAVAEEPVADKPAIEKPSAKKSASKKGKK